MAVNIGETYSAYRITVDFQWMSKENVNGDVQGRTVSIHRD